MVTQALYSIEFFDNERNLMPYCYFELYINGNLVTGLPPRADSHGKVWITRELVESMDGIPKMLSIRLWNSTFPKTQNSETEEFIWPEGKTSIKAFLPDVYTINTRPLANENDEEQSYQRAYYLVRKGDTWTKLEIELGSNTVEALMLHNRMSYVDQLVEGAKLYYPLGFRTRNEVGSNTGKKPSEKKEERKEEKKVQPRTAKKEPEKKVEQPKKMKEEEKSQKLEKKEEPKPGETKQENTIEQRSQANGKPEEVAKPKEGNKENGFYYNKDTGMFEGQISDGLGDVNRVFSCTGKNENKYENVNELPIKHSEFRVCAKIIYHESKTEGLECICIAFSAKNRSKRIRWSIYKLLMSGYSSVHSSDKTQMELNTKNIRALDSRKGLILALLNEYDPTKGAEFWDGTDFLAWGLSNPSRRPHPKFTQYTKIIINRSLFDEYVLEQTKTYGSSVRYGKSRFSIPASVFLDKNNWKNDNFEYITGVKKPPAEGVLIASKVAGHTIFWRIER